MTTLIRNDLPSSSDNVGDDCDYCDNYVEIMYKDSKQFRMDLQHALTERSGIRLLDLVVVVPEARDSIDEITSIFNELELDGEECLGIDGSYRFVMKSDLHGSISSTTLHILSNKIVAQSLVEQKKPPSQTNFKPTDAGLSDIFLPLLSSLTGDSYYPPLVVECGVSQKTSEFIYASLMHARAPGMAVDTILAADIKIGIKNDEIHLSRFDLHHVDFSLENLKHILQGLPASEDANTILMKESLNWAIHIKIKRSIAYIASLALIIRETIALNSIVDQPDTPEEIQAREDLVERIDGMLSGLDLKWQARASMDEMVALCQHLGRKLRFLGDPTTVISRLDETRRLFEADLDNFPISRNIDSETATQSVITLVLKTHQTYDLCDPAILLQGFRIPVSSILSIPTEQKWIYVTATDLEELFETARFHIRRLEGSIVNMLVPKDSVKECYQRMFLRLARGQSNAQTFEDLFSGSDTIDTRTCVKFVPTEKIISYLRDQGVQLNRSANRVTVVSRLLDLYSESNEIDFRMNCSTLEYFHEHRRTEVALNILHRSGRHRGQDPWVSLQDFVRRQGEMIFRLPLKYFSNDGLVKLHHMHDLVPCKSGRREDFLQVLSFQATSLNPDTQDGEDEPMEDLQWIEELLVNSSLVDQLNHAKVIRLLEGVTDPEQQSRIAEAAHTDPFSFAVSFFHSSNQEELLNELNLA